MSTRSGCLAVLVILTASRVATAETVTLQQGIKDYSSCTTRLIREMRPAASQPVDSLPLRGSDNDLLIKFNLPSDLARKDLARARLMIFVPQARQANAFTEIFCHEVVTGGRQIAIDEVTDYGNGRRAGAVDSVELFSPQKGPGWLHYPFLPLGIPAGGEWLEFNITPLVEKWLDEPATNHGVLLVPTGRPDGRYASTWEMDIPAAGYEKDSALRPKLLLEVAPLEHECLVGMTDSLERICDRSTRYAYRGSYARTYELSMAVNEFEAFQVVLYPLAKDLNNLRFTWTDLKGEQGSIPASDIECFLEDSYPLLRNWMTSGVFFGGKLYETVDPLIPAKPADLKRHVHTPFYFRVRTRPDTSAGTYTGKIIARADNGKPLEMQLTVKVWPYSIPTRWNFHTMGQFIWGNAQRFHGQDWGPALARKYYDFLLDHRFAPAEQYGQILSPRQDLQYCLSRGMNTIYLSGNFTGTDAEMAQLKKDYEKIKAMKALDCALVYVGDETSEWARMRRRADLAHAYLPGVQVMVGGSFPRKELQDYIDIYDPQIGGDSKVFSLQESDTGLIRASQDKGEQFYWYVAAGPSYPYPNVQPEYPLVDCRSLFWMTWKYNVTGFEYYCYNIWNRNYAKDPTRRYPNTPWKADGWEKGWPSNGDGMLFYPGPISSLRFESIRDGIEDYESLQVLRDCVEAVRHRQGAGRFKDLIDRAEKMLAVDDEVVAGFDRLTRDPRRLLAERQALGDLIAEFMAVVPKTGKWDAGACTYPKAVEVRLARQTAARRQMLRDRHLKACKALDVDPLPQQQWDALWPERVLLHEDFDGPKRDWDGQVVTADGPSGKTAALAAAPMEKNYARRIRIGAYYDHVRAATTTRIRFRYHLSKDVPLTIYVFDLTQKDNLRHDIQQPVVGQWAEATLNVGTQFRRVDGSGGRLQAGDAIDDVFFFAGKTGDELDLVVDDVELIGQD